jgi:hypothetical protein
MSQATYVLAITLLVALLVIDRLTHQRSALAVAAKTTPATVRDLTRRGPGCPDPSGDADAEATNVLAVA